jgi:hypothetical protein
VFEKNGPQGLYSTVRRSKPVALAPFGEKFWGEGVPAVVFSEDPPKLGAVTKESKTPTFLRAGQSKGGASQDIHFSAG